MSSHDGLWYHSRLASSDVDDVDTAFTVGLRAELSNDEHTAGQDKPLESRPGLGLIDGVSRSRFDSPACIGHHLQRARPESSTSTRAYRDRIPSGEPAGRIRILIAVAVRLYREGLSEILGRDERFEVVALAADQYSTLRCTHELQPDIVFLDVSMPDGLRLVHELRAEAPAAAVVATAVTEAEGEIVACAEAGVAGFVTRDQSLAEAVRVLESVGCGESPCSPRAAAALLRRVAMLSAQREPPGPPDGLTPREREIAGLIAQGRSNKEIARELYIEISTVKNHVHHMLEKLGVRSRTEAAVRVRAHLPP